jgi:hypothetical protein
VPTTTTTTFHLIAITDDSITKIHLGAKERPAGKTWCGVQLLVPGDTRFSGRYKDVVWEEIVKTSPEGSTDDSDGQPDLTKVDCGACKRSAAWKAYLASSEALYVLPAPKTPQDRKPPTTTTTTTTRKGKGKPAGVSANEAQEMANRAAEAGADAAAPPSTRKRRPGPRERAAAKDAARLAAEAASGSSVIEADPDTGLPRIKPEVAAKADAIAAAQVAKNAEAALEEGITVTPTAETAEALAADLPTTPAEFVATVHNILEGKK